MEVHISNLPPETTSNALKKYLRGPLGKFNITQFECKKQKGKRYGFLTLPDRSSGEAFLSAHQIKGSLRLIYPLILKRATHPPDAKLIEGLKRRQEDAATFQAEGRFSQSKNKFSIYGYSCGVLCFGGEKLAFASQFNNLTEGAVFFGRRSLTISSPPYSKNSTVQVTKIDIQYPSIGRVFTDERTVGEREIFTFTLALESAPKVIHLPKASADIVERMNAIMLREGEKPLRVRGANSDHESVLSTSLTYKVFAHPECSQKLRRFLDSNDYLSGVRLPLASISLKPPMESQWQNLLGFLKEVTALDFQVKFQLQRLVQNCYLLPNTVIALTKYAVKLSVKFDNSSIAQALRRMAREIPYPDSDTDPEELRAGHLAEKLREQIQMGGRLDVKYAIAKKHKHIYLVHHALVTPAGVYLDGPEPEPANRVLRRYEDKAHSNFLRVKFKDEDGSDVKYDRVNSLEHVHQKWFRESVLEDCLQIGGQKFTFLGFSNSSLRDQTCWFMSEFQHNNESLCSWDVVRSLGNFSEIRSPAKCAARIGQAFSDTHGGAVELGYATVSQIPDVERNGRVFSDGCGTVSLKLLQRIWKTYRRNCRPTCFQIRYAGAKGMISLDSRLEGEVLCIRPSMLKFEAPDNSIEICDAARRALPFFLNRQIIKILEDLKISNQAFLELQGKAISSLRANASSPSKAASFLDRYNIGRSYSLSWFIETLNDLGLSCFDDHFMRSCIEHAVIMQLRLIKHKARIHVENAHTLFGIMDETARLNEGEVFCRADGKTKVGIAVITRSPALHPGDIQVVRAVKVEPDSPLMDLDNCIAFSQKGERDLPSKLSGGDLDGDLYNIIFDTNLIPKFSYNPADYPRVKAVELYREVEAKDITKWFIDFMENDQLPNIATTHQHMADREPEGTASLSCVKLSRLHSDAVDFQKSGVQVNMKTMPRVQRTRPDFMAPDPRLLLHSDGRPKNFEEEAFIPSEDEEENPDAAIDPDIESKPRLYYKSEKILGKLYRAVNEQSFLEEFEAAHRKHLGSNIMKKLFAHIELETRAFQWSHLVEMAKDVRQEYEEQLVDLMTSFSPNSRRPLLEIEAFIGEILGKGGSLPTRQVRESSFTLRDRFSDVVAYTIQRILYGNAAAMDNMELEVEPNWADTSSLRDEALERSIACLHVGMQKGETWRAINNQRLESFQYVAGMVALRELHIFKRRTGRTYLGVEIIDYS